MVYNPEGVKGEGVEYVLVNPKIISSSKKVEEFTEGCLSFPEINADVVVGRYPFPSHFGWKPV
jgi:peptide deformylase